MSDPMQNLNNAADALNQVANRAAGFWDEADAQIVQRQAAYDNLANDLRGVVETEMFFTGTIDPTAVATNVRGGVFNSLIDFVNSAPEGAFLQGAIPGDITVEVTDRITLRHQFLQIIQGAGGVNKPVLRFKSYAAGGYNEVASISGHGNWGFRGRNVNIEIEGFADPALPWSWRRSAFTANNNAGPGFMPVTLNACDVSGADGAGLVSVHAGGICAISLMTVNFDGPIFAMVGGGKFVRSEYSVGMLNGAAFMDPGSALVEF